MKNKIFGVTKQGDFEGKIEIKSGIEISDGIEINNYELYNILEPIFPGDSIVIIDKRFIALSGRKEKEYKELVDDWYKNHNKKINKHQYYLSE